MKYNHLLILNIIITSMISGMEIKRTSSLTKEALSRWIYREKTIITIADRSDNSHDVSIESTDQERASDMDNKTNENSPRKNKLVKEQNFERY